jgi:type II secretory pathway pseudopilin PulG
MAEEKKVVSRYHNLAQYIFLYLLILITLGFVGIALGQVAFQVINYFLPETTFSYDGGYSQEVLRFAISALIVAGPVYFFATRKVNKDLAAGDLNTNTGVRKWLTYLILLAASCTAIGFFIGLLNSFLAGDLTLKFALKVLSALVISGGFGGYYIYDLKRVSFEKNNILKAFEISFIVALIVALAASFSLIDSPATARAIREDTQRVSNLQQISWQIQSYFELNKKLPESLDALVTDAKIESSVTKDPVTGEAFTYTLTDAENYQLCANFNHSDKEADLKNPKPAYTGVSPEWQHAAGKQCFKIKLSMVNGKDGYPTSEVKPIQ